MGPRNAKVPWVAAEKKQVTRSAPNVCRGVPLGDIAAEGEHEDGAHWLERGRVGVQRWPC